MPADNQPAADMQRIEQLVQQIESTADPNMKALAVELVQSLLEMHGSGMARMLDIISQSRESAGEIIDRFSCDELVGQLLILYDLHPVDLETRVNRALDRVRPQLESHGGDVKLLGIVDGVVQLRLEGNCDGCPSSSLTMRNLIEEAINESAADAAGLEVVGLAEDGAPPGLIPPEAIIM